MRGFFGVLIVAVVLLFVWAMKADRNYCERMLKAGRTNTDTLIVLTSKRCALIATDVR